jgi:hypothetical protein
MVPLPIHIVANGLWQCASRDLALFVNIHSLLLGTYLMDVSQFTEHIINKTVYISYGKSDLHVAHPHKSMSCLCPRNELAFL